MSLYAGKSILGDPILHVTSGAHSKEIMQSDIPIADTLFHSKCKYLTAIDAITSDYYTFEKDDPNTTVPESQIFRPVFSAAKQAQIDSYRAAGYTVAIVEQYIYYADSTITLRTEPTWQGNFIGGYASPDLALDGGFNVNLMNINGASYSSFPYPDAGNNPVRTVGVEIPNACAGMAIFKSLTTNFGDFLLRPSNLVATADTTASSQAYNISGSHTMGVTASRSANYNAGPTFGVRPVFNIGGSSILSPTLPQYNPGYNIQWDPGLTGLNTAASIRKRVDELVGRRTIVYILNQRYTPAGEILQDSPFNGDSIYMDNTDLRIGTLAMKTGLIMADPDPVLTHSTSTNSSSTGFKTTYIKTVSSNIPKNLSGSSISKFFDIKQPTAQVTRSFSSSGIWSADSISGPMFIDIIGYLNSTNPTFVLEADSIKYRNDATSKDAFIASPNSGFRLYNLTDESLKISIPGKTNWTYNTFVANTPGLQVNQASPSSIGINDLYGSLLPSGDNFWYRQPETPIITIPFPTWLSNANSALLQMGLVRTNGSYVVSHNGKVETLNVNINPILGLTGIRLWKISANDPTSNVLLVRVSLAAGRSAATEYLDGISTNFTRNAANSNYWTSVILEYRLFADFNTKQFIIKQSTVLMNQSVHAHMPALNPGQISYSIYLNKMGNTEALFSVPEIYFNAYPLSIG